MKYFLVLISLLLSVACAHQKNTYSREDTRAVFRASLGEIKDCYEKNNADPKPAGKMVLTIEVDDDGSVRKTSMKKSLEPELDNCVMAVIAKKQFPKPPEKSIAVIDYPFVFTPPGTVPAGAKKSP